MMNSLVSIILPNYNHALFLKERLDSIFNQTYTNFEVIILDDGSSDNSLSVLEPYKNHPKLSHFILNKLNTGSPFKQWEKGLNLIKGDYIWIAESDDVCKLDFLEKQLKILDQGNFDVAVAKTLKFSGEEERGEVQHPVFRKEKKEILSSNDILYCPILNVSAVVFKSHLYKNAQTFSQYKIIGDRVFYHEVFLNKTIIKNEETISNFRVSETSVSKLDNRSFDYYQTYFLEHLKFIKNAYLIHNISIELYNTYVTRFFNRVRYRMSRKEKLQFKFLNLYWIYKRSLKKII